MLLPSLSKITYYQMAQPLILRGNIAAARAVRTLGVGHAPSHRVDNQTGRVVCEFDF